MALLESQQKGFEQALRLIEQGEKRIIIQGLAGTGKTYLASEFIKFAVRSKTVNPRYNNGAVFATAPTNKALAVLQAKIPESRVDFKTIHSACRLKAYRNKAGIMKFYKSKFVDRNEKDFAKCKIAFIDECSMLNSEFLVGKTDTETGDYIPSYLEDYPFPIIFLGDDHQLNPVGELTSPVFHQGYPVINLTEIVRQGAGNPIIDLSRDTDLIPFKTPRLIEGKGYIYNDNKDAFIDDLAEANGCDDLKYLAYTNIDVDLMNALVRERKYKKPNKIELGETLVFNEHHESHYTNEEIKVEELEVITSNVAVPNYSTRFDSSSKPLNGTDYIKMKYYRINNSFNIIHEHSEQVFKTIFLTLEQNYEKYAWDGRARYFFAEQFADIKYNHAITVHKSQGSTYKEAIINIGNINFNKNIVERRRMLYTAVTRASDLVILNNVK